MKHSRIRYPAKFARGLIERIVDHGLAMGYWKRGDWLADCFGGVALGGIICGGRGLNWVGVELEPRFVELGNQNLALHKTLFEHEEVDVRLVQGDSRQFASIVSEAIGEKCGAVVTSPPFQESLATNVHTIGFTEIMGNMHRKPSHTSPSEVKQDYGTTPGQIGSLKSGSVDGVVTSPPYAETAVEKSSDGVDMRKNWETYRASGGGSSFEAYCRQQAKHSQGYGVTEGQIGALKEGQVDAAITSPPYAESLQGDDKRDYEAAKIQAAKDAGKTEARATWGVNKGSTDTLAGKGYGVTPGNIGNLKEGRLDGAVTSPPWENQEPSHAQGSKFEAIHRELHPTKLAKGRPGLFQHEYGNSNGQIGNDSGETYWQAMRAVYAQMHAALKPHAIAAIIVKDYVKAGKRVPLCDDTCRLLESLGFTVFERTRAMLVKETRHPDLFGGEDHVERKERKSFFRRLCEFKAAARQWFSTQPRETRANWIRQAHSDSWQGYRSALLEWQTTGKHGNVETEPSKPNKRSITTLAEARAYRAAGEPEVAIDTRIDWEEVIWARK